MFINYGRRRLLQVVFVFMLAATIPGLHGMMLHHQESVPFGSLIERLQERIEADPEDAHARYNLGRVHYLAAVRSREGDVFIMQNRHYKSPNTPGSVIFGSFKDDQEEPMEHEVLLEHVRRAVKYHRQALEMAAEPLYHLGLASVLQELSEYAGNVDLQEQLEVPEDLQSLIPQDRDEEKKDDEDDISQDTMRWKLVALEHYAKAFEKQIEADIERPSHMDLGMISAEASNQYRKLAERVGADEIRPRQMEHITEKTEELFDQPIAITPIILSLGAVEGIRELVDEGAEVSFDLDGTGRQQRWSWIKPDTGLLVWDPEGEGVVNSGRQLFGNVTWWMFWGDGYEALSMLDADGSGWLRGEELNGLAVWFDRSGDGVSRPGEVVSVQDLGIEAIAVEATTQDAGMPMAERGVKFEDGRVLPTWDWIAEPADKR
ncbi:MAG: hypothetical protein JJT75_04335 [Opitutales bacterium]|nr:hypothetical protein [Opitutales bacterium]